MFSLLIPMEEARENGDSRLQSSGRMIRIQGKDKNRPISINF